MRNLKLRYILELVSNIDKIASKDARALEQAQQRMQQTLKGTDVKIGGLTRTLMRLNGLSGAGIDRQAKYLGKLAQNAAIAKRQLDSVVKKGKAVYSVGAGVAAGAAAAYHTTGYLVKKPMDYSAMLAQMANTAFADRSVEGRRAGKKELDAVVRKSIRAGGGSMDQGANSLNELLASGVLGDDSKKALKSAETMLPAILRAATASGAAPEELTQIAIRAMQAGNAPERIRSMLNDALVAGQKGGFELRDQARWLPQAMAAGQQSGLVGEAGYRRIVASMQASVTTAGTRDEAGNNVVNLLAKINSETTARDMEKLGIDLTARLASDRKKGIDALDSFVGMVDQIAQRDKQFVSLQKQLASAKDDSEKRQINESMVNLLQGKAVGQVIQDRQALMALVAELNQRQYIQDVLGAMQTNPNEMDTSFAVMAQESDFKKQQKDNALQMASLDAFDKIAPALNEMYDGVSSIAQKYPTLTAGMVGATGALTVLTASASAASLAMAVTGGKAAGVTGLLSKGWAALTTTGGVTGGAAGAAGAKGLSGLAIPAAKLLGAGAVGYGVGTLLNKGVINPLVAKMTGVKDNTLGSALYDWMHPDPKAPKRQNAWARYHASQKKPSKPPKSNSKPIDPLRYLKLTAPKQSDQQLALGKTSEIKVGDGKLNVSVTVNDNLTRVDTSVAQQPSIVKVSAGATNPGGYSRRGGV